VSEDSRHSDQPRRLEAQFGNSTPYSLGIEEEFQLVDSDTLELVAGIEPVLEAFSGEALQRRVKPELLQSVVEVSTRISVNVEEALGDLVDLRARLDHAAADSGAAIASAGTHPLSRYDDQEVTDRPRYTKLAETFGWLVARHMVFGLHIHVGVSSAAKAIACANGLRRHVPELLALSANSPFWQGRQTGLASTRALVIQDLPRTGLPPAFASYDEFELLVQQGVETHCFPDYTHLWWDIRPHPRFGTVEVRICDAQTRIENVAAITALVQSLIAKLGSDFECGETAAAPPEILLEESKWRATRDGLAAVLIDFDEGTERPAADAIRALVDSCAPAADALGCAEELSLVLQILARGNGADEQLQLYAETGKLSDVTRWLAEQTVSNLTLTPAGPALLEL
jgi:carboxylate-amine ligase